MAFAKRSGFDGATALHNRRGSKGHGSIKQPENGQQMHLHRKCAPGRPLRAVVGRWSRTCAMIKAMEDTGVVGLTLIFAVAATKTSGRCKRVQHE